MRMLGAMDSAGAMELRDTTYGLLAPAAQAREVSKATVSRDFALVRRVHRQFGRMIGRNFDPKSDKIFWSWDSVHYGFIAPESAKAGFRSRWATSPSTLANWKLRSPMAALLSCPGTTAIQQLLQPIRILFSLS